MKRYFYRKNTLADVICQLRYPELPSIDDGIMGFKEALSQEYQYSMALENVVLYENEAGAPAVKPKIITVNNYRFETAGQRYIVNLTKEFYALSTSRYSRWEDFLAQLESFKATFEKFYLPGKYVRIGLRYVNVISKKELGIPQETSWEELICPTMLGLYTRQSEVQSMDNNFSFRYDDQNEATVRISTPMGKNGLGDMLVIDSDFFRMLPDKATLKDILEQLHNHSREFIEEAFQEPLRVAMGKEEM